MSRTRTTVLRFLQKSNNRSWTPCQRMWTGALWFWGSFEGGLLHWADRCNLKGRVSHRKAREACSISKKLFQPVSVETGGLWAHTEEDLSCRRWSEYRAGRWKPILGQRRPGKQTVLVPGRDGWVQTAVEVWETTWRGVSKSVVGKTEPLVVNKESRSKNLDILV